MDSKGKEPEGVCLRGDEPQKVKCLERKKGRWVFGRGDNAEGGESVTPRGERQPKPGDTLGLRTVGKSRLSSFLPLPCDPSEREGPLPRRTRCFGRTKNQQKKKKQSRAREIKLRTRRTSARKSQAVEPTGVRGEEESGARRSENHLDLRTDRFR